MPNQPTPPVMALTVIIPFSGYNRGDLINDPATVAGVLATNAGFVVQIEQIAGDPTPFVPAGS